MQPFYDRKIAGNSSAALSESDSKNASPNNNSPSLPSISLPKGGGAIRGIGEKFGANPVTGTASVSIPISASPGRSGFGPSISLSYDSGSGNGPFGFGWNLSLPSITRKTDKGLPLYQDAEETDTFILSGSEDLVPVLVQANNGEWQHENLRSVMLMVLATK
jgi:virulence plasmid B protein